MDEAALILADRVQDRLSLLLNLRQPGKDKNCANSAKVKPLRQLSDEVAAGRAASVR